jgi:23S rRNA (adenine2503-C2)-methyltransferase
MTNFIDTFDKASASTLSVVEWVDAHKLPKYRINQFNQAFYREYISTFDELTTWPIDLRKELASEIPFSTINDIQKFVSKDGNVMKILFSRISDRKSFESVLMRHDDGRNTVCVSSMIGCPAGCTFCATGRMGYWGNLTPSEIIDQILFFARLLKTQNETISNIVFMGMGEPLLNLANVNESIKVITSPEMMAMSMRRITISTSGITSNLRSLIASGFRGRLALSLHAPNQKLRETLMPIARKYPLPVLIAELKGYADMTNKRVSYEYALIDGINDKPEHAKDLYQLLGTNLTHLNLIPYNPVSGVLYKRSTPSSIRIFTEILKKYRMNYTLRVTMGDDIQAACGQLVTNQS